MKYGKKESGHERKSPEGLAVLGYRGAANNLQYNELSRPKLTP